MLWSQPVKKKHRARIIEFFIDVAQECFNIGNFNSLMAIISECLGGEKNVLAAAVLTISCPISNK